MLGYRMPREPSTPRLVVWRRLRRLGVAQPVDGLAVLPQTSRTREALDWVAGRVLEAAARPLCGPRPTPPPRRSTRS